MRVSARMVRHVGLQLLRPQGGMFAMLHAVAAQGAAMLLNIATGIITARLLGPAGRGEFAALSLWLLMPSLFAIAGVQNAIVYHTGRRPKRAASFGTAGFMLSTVLFVPMALVCYWWMPRLMHGYSAGIVTLARIVLVISVINAWLIVVRQGFLAIRGFSAYNAGGYGASLIYCILLLILMGMGAVTPQAAVWAQLIATMTMLVVLTIGLAARWDWGGLRPLRCIPDMVRYSLKAAPIDVVTILTLNIDRLILIGMISPAEFGLYAVAISFAHILFVLQTAISAVAFVDLIKLPRAEFALFIHRTFRLLLWTLVILSGVMCLFDKWLLGTVYGPAFVQATPVFRILLIEASTACIGQVLMQAFLASGIPGVPSFVQLVTLGATVTGMFVFVPAHGAIGAALALAISSSLRLVLLLGGLRWIGVGIPNPLPRMSDLAPILAYLQRMKQAEPFVP